MLSDPGLCSDSVVLGYIPWLLAASEPDALLVLTARRLAPAEVLPLLPAGGGVRWRYLWHLVGEEGSEGPGVHTELALELVAAILREDPGLGDGGRAAMEVQQAAQQAAQQAQQQQQQQQQAEQSQQQQQQQRRRPGSKRPSQAASGGAAAGGSSSSAAAAAAAAAADVVGGMRGRLQAHLEASSRFDTAQVLQALLGSALWEEQVILHSKVGWGGCTSGLLPAVPWLLPAAAAVTCSSQAAAAGWLTPCSQPLGDPPGSFC